MTDAVAMTDEDARLPRLFTAAEVAAALGQTEGYVMAKCRRREWPHRRLSRGQVAFTADDYASVLDLVRVPAVTPEPTARLSFAPRSRRRL